MEQELDAVRERYARRGTSEQRYSMLQPDVWQRVHERQSAMLKLFVRLGYSDLQTLRTLEVGCGSGGNLLELLRFGFAAENLAGIELLPQRYEQARHSLPAAVQLTLGDACQVELPSASMDMVLVSVVFSSLLDDNFQHQLADRIWSWVKPGGGILWYDFTFDNPQNSDVRGVSLRQLQALFPLAHMDTQRLTLAPPLARKLARWHPALCSIFSKAPCLRTHVLAWLGKEKEANSPRHQ